MRISAHADLDFVIEKFSHVFSLKELNRSIVLHTTDGGKNWKSIRAGENGSFIDRLFFANEKYEWLFGRDNVYTTHDGGKPWRDYLKLPPLKSISK